jgi:hypothetical protein
MENVITDFSAFTDADLDTQAATIIKDCTGNAIFTFTGAH